MHDFRRIQGQFSQPTLAGMLAAQRQADIAKDAEQGRVVALALATGISARPAPDATLVSPGVRALGHLQRRFATARLAVARTVDNPGVRALHARTSPAHATSSVVCCA
jgi:orotidine-5'-phosphate decarboxylase